MLRLIIERAGETTLYLSTRDHEYSGQAYKAGVISVDDITWRLTHKTGGRAGYEYGGFKLAPDVFDWPPSESIDDIQIWYSGSFMFGGPARLAAFDQTGFSYSLVQQGQINLPFLRTGTDYDGNPIDFPQAFGYVEHVEPIQIADVSSAPTYDLGGLSGTIAKAVSTEADNGSGLTRITTSAVHGFTTSDVVTIEGDINHTGVVTVIDTTNFDTTLAYVAGITFGHAYKDGYFRVYDNGVPISGNASYATGGFSLSANPVGQVTMSGKNQTYYNTDHIATWCASRSSMSPTGGTSTPQAVNTWITQQYANPLDLLDEVFMSRGLYFWHQSPGNPGVGYLAWEDMAVSGVATPLDEDTVYGVDGYDPPSWYADNTLSIVTASWLRRSASGGILSETVRDATAESELTYGDRAPVEVFDSMNESDVNRDRLETFIEYENQTWCSVSIPFGGVGSGIIAAYFSVEDRATKTNIGFVVRGFQINFKSQTMVLSGEMTGMVEPGLVAHFILENDPLYWDGSKFLDQSGHENHGTPQVAGPVWSTKVSGQDCALFDKTWWLKVLHSASLNLTSQVRIYIEADKDFYLAKYPATYNGGLGYGVQGLFDFTGGYNLFDFLGSQYISSATTSTGWHQWECLYTGGGSNIKKKDGGTIDTDAGVAALAGSTADLMIGQRPDLAYNDSRIQSHKIREIKIYNTVS